MSDPLKICLYGEYGRRKTEQAGRLIDLVGGANVLIVEADQGLATIRSKLNGVTKVRPVCHRIYDPGDRGKFLSFVDAYDKEITPWAVKHPSGWVITDGATDIHNWIKNEQFEFFERYWQEKCTQGEAAPWLRPFSRFITNKDEANTQLLYEKVGRDSQGFVVAMRALPCHWLALYREDLCGKGERPGEKVRPYGPDVPGKVGLEAVMSAFDIVGRLWYQNCPGSKATPCKLGGDKVVDGRHTLPHLTAGFDPTTRDYMARVRQDLEAGNVIPPTVVDFDLARLVERVMGKAEVVKGKK